MNGRLGDVLACLYDLEDTIWEPYRHEGAGGPPRNPLGILKALVVKRFKNIPSDRKLYRACGGTLSLGAYATLKGMKSPIIHRSYAVLDSV